MPTTKKVNRYTQLIEAIFLKYYRDGMTAVDFDRSEIAESAKELGIALPKNLGDVRIHKFRNRSQRAVIGCQVFIGERSKSPALRGFSCKVRDVKDAARCVRVVWCSGHVFLPSVEMTKMAVIQSSPLADFGYSG